jgi:DNA-binding MarR family transcriptional regulator
MGVEQSDRIGAVLGLAFGARMVERALGEMTLPQFRVLSLIDSSPERASRIAEKAAVTRPSLTGLLDGLEARGWVCRVEVDGDRRGVGLEVTAEGRDALRAAEANVTDRLEQVLGEMPAAEQAVVLRGLDALGRTITAPRAAVT